MHALAPLAILIGLTAVTNAAPPTPAPDASVLYHFYDGCWAARDAKPKVALKKCQQLHNTDDRQRSRGCRCHEADRITVRTTDPVAYYFVESWAAMGSTPLTATLACWFKAIKHPGLDCTRVWPALGPYTRSRQLNEYDDLARYRYLGQHTGDWLDETGQGPCFVAGTQIETPRGPRAIESLHIGDTVWSWDLGTGVRIEGTILATRTTHERTVGQVALSDGTHLTVTRGHPFYLPGAERWVDADALKPGAVLLKMTTDSVRVQSVTWHGATATVYNLTVDGPHTYFAGGVLVHNY